MLDPGPVPLTQLRNRAICRYTAPNILTFRVTLFRSLSLLTLPWQQWQHSTCARDPINPACVLRNGLTVQPTQANGRERLPRLCHAEARGFESRHPLGLEKALLRCARCGDERSERRTLKAAVIREIGGVAEAARTLLSRSETRLRCSLQPSTPRPRRLPRRARDWPSRVALRTGLRGRRTDGRRPDGVAVRRVARENGERGARRTCSAWRCTYRRRARERRPRARCCTGIAGLAGWLPFAWRAPLQGARTCWCSARRARSDWSPCRPRSCWVRAGSWRPDEALSVWNVLRSWARTRLSSSTMRATSSRRSSSVRRRRAELRLRRTVGRARGGCRRRCRAQRQGRQCRPVRGRDSRPRFRGCALQGSDDPRLLRLRRAPGRAGRALPPLDRPRSRGRLPARRRAGPAGRCRRRMAASGRRTSNEARRRAVARDRRRENVRSGSGSGRRVRARD